MATRPQFEDSERVPGQSQPVAESKPVSDGPLRQEELAALREFLSLLDAWDKKKKAI